MKNGEKVGAIVIAAVIVILFLISSTDIFLKEDKNEVYNVSVIIDNNKDDTYLHYKKGMEKAAKEKNMDVSFETLYSVDEKESQQEEFVLQAVENGAEVIIISPVNESQLVGFLEEAQVKVPVIFLDSTVNAKVIDAHFTGDNLKMGEDLAKEIVRSMKGIDSEQIVYAYSGDIDRGSTNEIYEGLEKGLREQNQEVTLISYEELVRAEEHAIVVALDTSTLLQLVNQENAPKKLYGVGYSNQIVQYLADGKIKGIVTYNNYDLGYLSMEYARQLVNHEVVERAMILDHQVVVSDDVYKKEYESLLFPLS